ncbi:MAG: peptidyl-prolyl cis-trans isomerase [Lentisphaeria bacterium]|nr:peptidyl-prolyl cis-trans isomerase [Lentisphaeria bacterium]
MITETQKVVLETSMGNIKLELFDKDTPITVANFLAYVDAGHYDHTIFHRVIPGFMIQGGGFDTKMNQKPTQDPIKNEAQSGAENKRGTIAMARTSVVDSATCQFFINTVDNDFLNFSSPTPRGFGYCVFGQVIEGMDVVDKIEKVATTSHGMHQDVPIEPVIILKAYRA